MHPCSRLAVTFVLALPAVAAAAPIPLSMSSSGYLLDSGDHPVTQQGLALGFSVWTDVASPAETSRVWPVSGESACSVSVSAGFYTAFLDGAAGTGCGAGLSSDHVPPTSPRYLQVSVNGVVLAPRMRIGSVPNAALAARSADAQAFIAALASGGAAVNGDGSLVDWKALKGVPAGLADGDDANTTYTAGGGLALEGGAFRIADTAVAPGSYTYAAITVDQQGRITAASNGAAPTGTVTSVGTGTGLTGGPIATSGSISIADGGVTSTQLAADQQSLTKVSGGSMATSGGNVGIGAAPVAAARLSIAGAGTGALFVTDTGTGQASLKLMAGSGTTNRAARIDLLNAVTNPTVPRWTIINDYYQTGVNDLAITDGTTMPVLTILQGGNLGLGTTNPGARLEVAGAARLGSLFINSAPLASTDWRMKLKTTSSTVSFRNGGSLAQYGAVTHVQGTTRTGQPDYSYYYLLLWQEPVGVNQASVPFITFSGTVSGSRSNYAGTGGRASIHGGRGYNSTSALSINKLNDFPSLSFVHNVQSNGKSYAALLNDTHTGPGILDWWYDLDIWVGEGTVDGQLDDTLKSITSATPLH